MKKQYLGIIITVWNCPEMLLRRNLSSILIQQFDQNKYGIRIYIVIDDNKNYDNIILPFAQNLPIQIIQNEQNMGESETRNIGMRAAFKDECDFITIIDQDDSLYDCQSLANLMSHFFFGDIIAGKILFEPTEGKFQIIPNDNLWDHGCAYRSNLLLKHNIYFPKNHHSNDIAFNLWCNAFTSKKIYLNEITYSYRYYTDSLNHINNDEFKSNNMRQLMENFQEVYTKMQRDPQFSLEHLKPYVIEWFIKYYQNAAIYQLPKEQEYDLWRSLPEYFNLFKPLLLEPHGNINYQLYNEISCKLGINGLGRFSLDEFISLILKNYLPS